MSEIKAGDLVRCPEEEIDGKERPMVVLEDRGNRVLVQDYIEGWKIQPTFVYLKSDLIVVK